MLSTFSFYPILPRGNALGRVWFGINIANLISIVYNINKRILNNTANKLNHSKVKGYKIIKYRF